MSVIDPFASSAPAVSVEYELVGSYATTGGETEIAFTDIAHNDLLVTGARINSSTDAVMKLEFSSDNGSTYTADSYQSAFYVSGTSGSFGAFTATDSAPPTMAFIDALYPSLFRCYVDGFGLAAKTQGLVHSTDNRLSIYSRPSLVGFKLAEAVAYNALKLGLPSGSLSAGGVIQVWGKS